MQRFLSTGLWKNVSTLSKRAKSRSAAIAYVTIDHLHMQDGDQLIVDASDLSIRCGETKAALLMTLYRKGVQIYSCPSLHAKVALLDDIAFVGSANLSNSSANRLIEAGLLTDHPGTVAAVQSFLAQLTTRSKHLDRDDLLRLKALSVSPRRGPANATGSRTTKLAVLGDRTWLMGVRELPDDAHPGERDALAAGEMEARAHRQFVRAELSWIRLTGKGKFAKECRAGDVVIQIWRPIAGARIKVLRPATVIHRSVEPTCTRIHLEPLPGLSTKEMTLLQFRKLLAGLSFTAKIGPGSVRVLTPELAETVLRHWKLYQR